MRSVFVQPELVRLSLSGGDEWIDVKKTLNAGETRRVFARLVKTMRTGGESFSTELDPEKVGVTKLVEYIVGWSFKDSEGKPVPVSEAALDNLMPDVYRELIELIDKHEDEQKKASEAAKEKNPTGAIRS